MKALAPLFAQLGQMAGSILVPAATMLASVIDSLTPLFKSLMEGVRILTTVWLTEFKAVAGIFSEIGGLFSIFSALMSPLQKLFEVVMTLATAMNPFPAIMSAVGAVFAAVGEMIQGVMDPILGVMDEVALDLKTIFDVIGEVFHAVVQTLIEFVKSLMPAFNLKGVMDTLRAATLKVIEAITLFAARISKMFGNNGFIDNLIAGLQGKKDYAHAAPTNVGEMDVAGIARQMALASALAVGHGSDVQENKIDLSNVVNELQNVKNGTDTGFAGLKTSLDAVVTAINNVKALIPQPPSVYDIAKHGVAEPAILARKTFLGF